MSKYTQVKLQAVDEERELRLLLMRQELKALLWQDVAIPDSLMHRALGYENNGSWQALKATGDAPPRIELGKRRYVLVADLKEWLEARPKTLATKERRNNKAHHDDDARASTGSRPASALASVSPTLRGAHARER